MTPHNFLISFKKLDRIVTYREWEAQQMAGRPAKTCVAPAENTKPMEDINEGKKFSFKGKKAKLFQHLNFFWVIFFYMTFWQMLSGTVCKVMQNFWKWAKVCLN